MPFDAKIFKVLIASPSDVGEERTVIPELINEWNALNAVNTKFLLMPVKWETHSAPLLGNRAQAIINEQLVTDCDLLVGVFWTRIGTNTGLSISGTVEEIEQFVASKKPVMLYFSQSPIDPDRIDIEQFSVLKNFKEKMRLQGLIELYSNIPDFRQKFSRQLGINVGNIINNLLLINRNTKKEPSEALAKKINKNNLSPITSKEQITSQKIDDYLIKACQSVSNKDGWANVAAVGRYLYTFTPVNYKELGYQKLSEFLKSRKLFEIKIEKVSKTSTLNNYDTAMIRLIDTLNK
ncbi:MAG TPA: OST-HTH/LOTUS domain-containing protein [Chitinophagaceae bacterium]|nr:OST-HTH/LOTUS domain-containing protein [Chitinophagaceae bacterium]